jgi:hypothetical protein
MAGKTERTRVEINESTTDGLRVFNITLTAPASDFALTDLLKQRSVIEGLDADLKQAIKGATESYLNAAETLIAKLAVESTPGRKSRTNGKRNGQVDNDQRLNQMPASDQARELSSKSAA